MNLVAENYVFSSHFYKGRKKIKKCIDGVKKKQVFFYPVFFLPTKFFYLPHFRVKKHIYYLLFLITHNSKQIFFFFSFVLSNPFPYSII